jgi:ATP phosphoribosyltransferase
MIVKIAVPKGHLEETTVRLLEDSGIGAVNRESRQLFARTNDPEIELVFVRAQDIPDLVAKGATDLGITGYDLVRESGSDVVELLDLGYGYAKIVVAAHEKSNIKSAKDIKSGMRVATEFPKVAGSYFSQKGIKVELTRVTGAAEITPLIGVADLVVDVTSTGTTLRTHGLQIIDTILESSARLIANRRSMREKKAKIEDITTAMGSVIRARGRKLVLMNVPEAKLPDIKRIMPGMAGPTVSRVEAAEPMLAVQAVVEADKVYEIVRKVKQAGARDILVVPIERILP